MKRVAMIVAVVSISGAAWAKPPRRYEVTRVNSRTVEVRELPSSWNNDDPDNFVIATPEQTKEMRDRWGTDPTSICGKEPKPDAFHTPERRFNCDYRDSEVIRIQKIVDHDDDSRRLEAAHQLHEVPFAATTRKAVDEQLAYAKADAAKCHGNVEVARNVQSQQQADWQACADGVMKRKEERSAAAATATADSLEAIPRPYRLPEEIARLEQLAAASPKGKKSGQAVRRTGASK